MQDTNCSLADESSNESFVRPDICYAHPTPYTAQQAASKRKNVLPIASDDLDWR